ncbi:hypothetical protein EF808_02070 [archaeon]|nr:MAG: hypothetical protein EF808_02070 [archaeon]
MHMAFPATPPPNVPLGHLAHYGSIRGGAMNIEVMTRIYPTEDEGKIVDALSSLFPDIEFEREGPLIRGKSTEITDLSTLRDKIDRQEIRDTARTVVRRCRRGQAVTLHLNKQVATAGRVNFSEESPLGPITLRISGDINQLNDYLAPSTLE